MFIRILIFLESLILTFNDLICNMENYEILRKVNLTMFPVLLKLLSIIIVP